MFFRKGRVSRRDWSGVGGLCPWTTVAPTDVGGQFTVETNGVNVDTLQFGATGAMVGALAPAAC